MSQAGLIDEILEIERAKNEEGEVLTNFRR
jgi:hypothetical protein